MTAPVHEQAPAPIKSYDEQRARAIAETAVLSQLEDNQARTKHLAGLAMSGELNPRVLAPQDFSLYFSDNEGGHPAFDLSNTKDTGSLLDPSNPKSREVAQAAHDAHQVANYAYGMRVGASRRDQIENFFTRHMPGSDGRAVRRAIKDGIVPK